MCVLVCLRLHLRLKLGPTSDHRRKNLWVREINFCLSVWIIGFVFCMCVFHTLVPTMSLIMRLWCNMAQLSKGSRQNLAVLGWICCICNCNQFVVWVHILSWFKQLSHSTIPSVSWLKRLSLYMTLFQL